MRKKIYNSIQNILIAVAVVVVLFLLVSRFLPELGYGLYIIQSGSMQPTIKTGAIVIDKKQPAYQKGEIITFVQNKNEIITHRITEIIGEGKETTYKTKGDANNSEDLLLAKKNTVLGKVILMIPYFGYLISFVKTKMGFGLCIIIPSLWFILEEGLHLRRMLAERKLRKRETE